MFIACQLSENLAWRLEMETHPPPTAFSNRLRKNRMSGANCPITDFCPITGELPCIQLINYVQTVDKCAIFTKKNNLRYFIDFTLFRLIFRFFSRCLA